MRILPIFAFVVGCISLAPSSLANDTSTGVIKGYECGDNCYLTITKDNGEELTALCAADECAPWNEQSVMPDEMIGKAVEVTITSGKQYDGAGNEMGEFPSFAKVTVVAK